METNKINPEHYKLDGGKQAIDLIQKELTSAQFIGFLKGNIMKYELRAGRKEGESRETDLEKAAWYRDRLNKYNKHLDDKMADMREPFY